MTFEQWLKAVDDKFQSYVGCDKDSWPDQDYWNMWNDGVEPLVALAMAINNEYGMDGLISFSLEHLVGEL